MGDVYNDQVAVDTHMLMCLIANSVATVAVVVVIDWLNRKQRSVEDDGRYQKLCERIEREREGWAAEREAVVKRVQGLETRVMEYQKQLAAQYRQQLIDHQGCIDKRIETIRFDSTAAKLADWRPRDPPSAASPYASDEFYNHPSTVSLPGEAPPLYGPSY